MKKILVPTLFLGALLAAQAQFTPGNLAVEQIGNGSAALSSAATPIFIDEFTTAGAPVQTIAITGASALTDTGTGTSDGALTRSTDGSVLTFAGYFLAAGTAGVTGSSAPRAVGVVNASGQYSQAATSSSDFLANNTRSAVSDGNNHWITGTGTGTSGGLWYSAGGAAPTQITTGGGNFRNVNIFNGNLYYSTASGTAGIYAFTGIPTIAATATLLFATGTGSSPYDFALNAAGNIAYVADDRSAASGGGIEKWVFNGTAWTLSYTLALGTTTAGGARQLTVDWSGANPIIYATTTETSTNRLVDIADTGAGAVFNTLATAGANTVFRGVDFAPTPEPSTLALGGLGLAAIAFFRRHRKA